MSSPFLDVVYHFIFNIGSLLGLSTREKETIELTGGDFDRNIEQLKLIGIKIKDLQRNYDKAEDTKNEKTMNS